MRQVLSEEGRKDSTEVRKKERRDGSELERDRMFEKGTKRERRGRLLTS